MLEFIVPFTDKAAAEKLDRYHGTNGELVRCRDCVYGCLSKNVRGEDRVFCENPDFEGMDYLVNEPDWYCADGERRDGE